MHAKGIIIAVFSFSAFTLFAYEDLTHQALTRQAVEVAHGQDNGTGIGQELYDLQQQIIDGAGRSPRIWKGNEPNDPDAGEDYTAYGIGECWHVARWPAGWEAQRHFARKLINHVTAEPAYPTFLQFYQHAGLLW